MIFLDKLYHPNNIFQKSIIVIMSLKHKTKQGALLLPVLPNNKQYNMKL